MKRLLVAMLAIFVLSIAVMSVAADRPSPYFKKGHYDIYPRMNDRIELPANMPRFDPNRFNQLDEVFGDTLIIGSTGWESQHNGTVGRMIGLEPNRDGFGPTCHIVWTDLESQGGSRHVKYSRVFDVDGVMQFEAGAPWTVDAATRAGYTTMGIQSATGLVFPAYHASTNPNNPTEARLATEWSLFPGIFTEFAIPQYEANENIWPKTALATYDDVIYLHTVTHENRAEPSDLMDILYSRASYDPATETMTIEDQQLITDYGMNIAADVAVSNDGSRVAIAQTAPLDINAEETSQLDNDLWLWLSEDGGETWDWANPINITSFIPPDDSYLPDDTTSANRDTLRCYTDVNVYFDHDDILHVAFTTPKFWHYEGLMSHTSLIYHWDEESDVFTIAANGEFWNMTVPGAWQRIVQRPNMYQDPETRILYMVYQQYGVEGDTTADGIPRDASDDGFANGEIFMTATPPNNGDGDWYGRLWAKGINLTNSRGTEGGLAAGDCRNEREPSIALNNEGEYLNLFYILDLDAGFTEQTEGEYTDCPAVWHRVNKMDLIDAFNDQGEWVPNKPMHVDSTKHWTDSEYEYSWIGGFIRDISGDVNDEKSLLPGEFELGQNFPNPFNPSTSISFSLARAGSIELAVFDVLGREVAMLANGVMSAGSHTVSFHGGDLASGVYFYKLKSGNVSEIRKMVLMK